MNLSREAEYLRPQRWRHVDAGDRLVATNATLGSLMIYALSPLKGLLMRQQILGGPQWMDSDHFDIEAKLAGAQSIPPDQSRLMLQQSDTSVPSLFSAIEDVGLKLESAKAQLD